MFCKHCGNELPDNSKFCPNCGEKVNSSYSDIATNTDITNDYDDYSQAPYKPEPELPTVLFACAGLILFLGGFLSNWNEFGNNAVLSSFAWVAIIVLYARAKHKKVGGYFTKKNIIAIALSFVFLFSMGCGIGDKFAPHNDIPVTNSSDGSAGNSSNKGSGKITTSSKKEFKSKQTATTSAKESSKETTTVTSMTTDKKTTVIDKTTPTASKKSEKNESKTTASPKVTTEPTTVVSAKQTTASAKPNEDIVIDDEATYDDIDLDDESNPTAESEEPESVKSKVEKKVQEYIDANYAGTVIDSITVNEDLGTDVDGDYVALVWLTWNRSNSGKLSKEVLDLYSSDMAARMYKDLPEIQELAVFWTVPYLNNGSAKISFERKSDGMYYTDTIFDSNFD